MLRLSHRVFLASLIWLCPFVTFAATYTWDSDGDPNNGVTDGSGIWDIATANWFNAGTDIAWPNNTTDIAAFGGSGSTGGAVTVSGSFSVGGINFNSGNTGSYLLSGTGNPTLTLGASGISVNNGAGAETFDNNLAISLTGAESWINNSANSLTINSATSMASSGVLSIGGTGNTSVGGVLSNGAGTLSLTINGTGTSRVTLSGANTYSGVTSVSSGAALQVANATGSATGTNTVSVGGSLQGSSSAGQGFITGPVTINNGGKLLAQSGATLTISNTLTLAAGSSSTFTLSGTPNGATGSPLVATGGGGGSSLAVSATHTININPLSTINVPSGMPYALYELYSYFGNNPSVTSTASPFTGVFAAGIAPSGFNLGLFEGTSAASIIINNQLDVAVGAKPFVYLKTGDAAGATSFNATGNWSNGVAPSSANNYVVSLSSLRSPTGATAATFAGNSLTLGAGSAFGIKTTGSGTTTTIPTLILNGGTVQNSGGSDNGNYLDVVAGTNFFVTSTSTFDALSTNNVARALKITAPISGPGGLIINPTASSIGPVTFTAANTYTGATTVGAGTLQLAAGAGLASTAALTLGSGASSATFQLGDATAAVNQTLSSLTTAGSGNANAVANGGSTNISTLTINNSAPDTFSGLIGTTGGGVSLNKLALDMSGSSTLTLSGANIYVGGTIVNGAGTLRLSGSGTLGSTSGPLTVSSGLVDLNGTSQGAGNFTGAGGTVLNNGSGTSLLTIGNGNGDGGNFAGVIANNNNSGAGTVALTKAGSGTITLSGLNTYTGATMINTGKLALAAPGGLGNTLVTVAVGATFSVRPGSGSITAGTTADPTVGATITVSPGAGPANGGTLDMLDGNIGKFNLNQGSNITTGLTLGDSSISNPPVLALEIADDGLTTSADQIFVTNGVSVGTGTGANISISAIGSNPLHIGTYPLITAGSFTNAAGFLLTTTAVSIGANQYSLSLGNTGTVETLIVSLGGPGTTYWSGAHDGNWNTLSGGATNWLNGPSGTDTGALPSGGTNVFFTATSAMNLNTTQGTDFAINSLTFTGAGTSATSAVKISGNNLTINASAANGNAAGNGISVQAGSGSHTIASSIILGASQTWTNSSSNPLTVSGGISDGGHNFGLTTVGSGPIVLSGNNSYGGTTTVSTGSILALSGANTTTGVIAVSGTLRVNSSGALGSSPVTLNAGSTIDNTAAGLVTNSGTNTFTWAGDWSFGGTKPLDLGAGSISSNNAAYTITLGGTSSSLTFGAALTNASGGAQTLTINGSGNTLAVGGYALTNDGTNRTDVVSGSGNLTITGRVIDGGTASASGLTYSGTGKLTLTGTNTYNGSTTLTSGTIVVGSATAGGSLPSTSTVNFNGTGTFNYQGLSTGSSQMLAIVNFNVGDGTLKSTYGSSGNTNLTVSSPVFRALGATTNYTVSGGTNGTTNSIVLSSATPDSFIDQGTFFGGNNYAWYDAGSFVRAIKYGTDANSASFSHVASINGAPTNLHVRAAGLVDAEQTNTFLTLNIATPTFNLADGAILTVNGILTSSSGAPSISGGAGIQAAPGAELVIRTEGFSTVLLMNTSILDNGSNSLTKSGAGFLLLNSPSTYSGTTTVANGTLLVGNLSGSATGSGPVIVNSGGTLNGGIGEVGGSVAVNSGGTLNGNMRIDGLTTINPGGILLGQSGATLFHLGGLSLGGGSTTKLVLSGTPNGPTNNPLFATIGGLTIGASNTVNVDPNSAINVPAGLPYALYQTFSYTGTAPGLTNGSPTGLVAGTAPSGLSLGFMEGAAVDGTNNQIDVAVGPKPFVYLKSADPGATSSFDAAGNWSNGAAPSAANDYIVALNSLRTPASGAGATFAGNSLTIAAGGLLGIKANSPSTTTINNLILDGGTVNNSQGVNGIPGLDVLAGNGIYLASTSFLDSGGTNVNRQLQVTAPMSGPGGIIANPVSTSLGLVLFSAANSYTGPTTDVAGTLQLGSGGSLSPATTLTVGGGAASGTFVLGDASAAINQAFAGLFTSGSGNGNKIVGGNPAISTITIANAGPDTFAGVIGGAGTNQNNLALTVAGSDVLTLTSPNTYAGPTIVNSGTLATTGAGLLGPGPLAVNSSGAASVVNLGNSQAVGGLSGAVSNSGSARVNVAPTTTLTINQSAAANFGGAVALAAGSPGGGGSLVKAGDSPLEIDGALLLGDGSSLAVTAGTFKLNVTSGAPSVGSGVVATVSGTGTLELAGSVSALGTTSAANRTDIANNSTADVGVLVSAGNHQVGGIDGSGNVQVNDGASLTANHIIAGSLAIGGNSALVTIAASNADGSPLGESSGGLVIAGELSPSAPFEDASSSVAGTSSANSSGLATAFAGELPDLEASPSDGSQSGSNQNAVPEPSTVCLLAIAAICFAKRHPTLRHRTAFPSRPSRSQR